jgi:hypothetical protein
LPKCDVSRKIPHLRQQDFQRETIDASSRS